MAMQPKPVTSVSSTSTPALATSVSSKMQMIVSKANMRAVGSKSLVIYGESFVGKTECVKWLVEAGLNVHYVDFEHNVTSILSVSDADNFQYYSVNEGNGLGIVEFFRKLMNTGEASVCHEHGLVECQSCKSNGLPFSMLKPELLRRGDVVVWDSASAIVRSINNASVVRNKRDTLQIITDERASTADNMQYFRSVSTTGVPIWHYMNKLPSNCGSLIITHDHDVANIMEGKSAKHFYHPVAVSGTYSISSQSKTPCTAVWALKRESNPANRIPIMETNVTHYAKTAASSDYKGLLTKDAVVKFFTE